MSLSASEIETLRSLLAKVECDRAAPVPEPTPAAPAPDASKPAPPKPSKTPGMWSKSGCLNLTELERTCTSLDDMMETIERMRKDVDPTGDAPTIEDDSDETPTKVGSTPAEAAPKPATSPQAPKPRAKPDLSGLSPITKLLLSVMLSQDDDEVSQQCEESSKEMSHRIWRLFEPIFTVNNSVELDIPTDSLSKIMPGYVQVNANRMDHWIRTFSDGKAQCRTGRLSNANSIITIKKA